MLGFYQSILNGYFHVLPYGLDHIAFIICIFLISKSWKEILTLCTAFTIAHSLTLFLALNKWIIIPSVIIEPLIALTILFAALENIIQLNIKRWKPFLIFFFGLIHGLGFANAFSELNVQTNILFQTLIGFNLGVELAQLTIILALYVGLTKQFAQKKYYQTKIVQPIAIVIACISVFWFMLRIFY